MSRHHQGQRHRSPLFSRVGVSGDSAVVFSPAAVSIAAEVSAALRIRYTYPLAEYLNFFLGGIQYTRCPLDGTAEATAEAEAADASDASDL